MPDFAERGDIPSDLRTKNLRSLAILPGIAKSITTGNTTMPTRRSVARCDYVVCDTPVQSDAVTEPYITASR